MVIDGHVHLTAGTVEPEALGARLAEAGIDGAGLISFPPPSFGRGATPWPQRLEHLLCWPQRMPNIFPLFWIDPLESDALEQVHAAAPAVAGFKIICDRYYVYDERPMQVVREIAAAGKPILFHAGILWDGKNSSRYNQPVHWEALLDVPNLRFALAHAAWPWCDELIAVYGKFLNARDQRGESCAEMFIDLTPGTPPVYREEVLRKLFLTGIDVGGNLIFGSDSSAGNYNVAWTREWMARDSGIYEQLALDRETAAAIFGGNFTRFIEGGPPAGGFRVPRPADTGWEP